MSILEKDVEIHFPDFTVLKASAGSGKTYTLTERFVQFLLSKKIPNNHLRNILAITFSNNASKEMKERVLKWLKSLYLEDPKTLDELAGIVAVERRSLVEKSGIVIDTILNHFADFQVRTIDSFMATIFRSSAIDFGYAPDFEILMDSDPVMEYAFQLSLKEVKEGTVQAELFEEIVRIMMENKKGEDAYLWDPSAILQDEIKKIYRRVAASGKDVMIEDHSKAIDGLKHKISQELEKIETLIGESGLERNAHSTFSSLLSMAGEGRFVDLIGKGLKNPPVKKPKKPEDHLQKAYDTILDQWNEVGRFIQGYAFFHARSYYTPYLKLYELLLARIEEVKKRQGKVFIEDINKRLSEYLQSEIVPDIYCRLGEIIFHFLIDEFQDTSPIQWQNLFPLIENTLAQGGSLFVVGDTKQAIYGFRDADYTIMKGLETENPFPSARHRVLELDTNYRSVPKILEFSEKVFKEIAAAKEEYRLAAEESGLTCYLQRPKEGWRQTGYVQVEMIDGKRDDLPERSKLYEMLQELGSRGYSYKEIAILTAKNEDVVNVTSWLSEKDIPSISYSSLDIRRRKVTGEIFSLLRFLDSPPDDLSFATFLLGDIFSSSLHQISLGTTDRELHEFLFRNRRNSPLYKAFQEAFRELWDRYFSGLFRSVGYLPLYDLVTEALRVFRVFEILKEDEAIFAKILEAVKDFEGSGSNSLRDFIGYADDGKTGGPDWEIDVPRNVNAVKVMTIHKAKGLEFPVVLVLLYGTSSRGFDYLMGQEGDEIVLLKLNQKIIASAPQFQGRYDEEVRKDRVNQLNSLYVSFTRAEEELYVIGIGKGEGKTVRPLDLLPVHDYSPSAKPERICETSVETEQTSPLLHPKEFLQTYTATPDRERLTPEERRRGEFIHRILSFIEYAEEASEDRLTQVIQRVSDEMRAECDFHEMRELIRGIVEDGEVKEFFIRRPEREIRREQEFVDDEGRLSRMDRLILDRDRIVVVDWKTGKGKEAEKEYETQMRNYLKVLEGIYPGKNLEGAIVYVDLKEVKRIH